MKRTKFLTLALSASMISSMFAVPAFAADAPETAPVKPAESKDILSEVRADSAAADKAAAQADADVKAAEIDVRSAQTTALSAISNAQKAADKAKTDADKALTDANDKLAKAKDATTKATSDQKTAEDAYYAAKNANDKAQDALKAVPEDAKASVKEAAQDAADKTAKDLADKTDAKAKADKALADAKTAESDADKAQKDAKTNADNAAKQKEAADALTLTAVSTYDGYKDKTPNTEISAYLEAVKVLDAKKDAKATADKDAAQKKAVMESVEKALGEQDSEKIDLKAAKVAAVKDVVYSGSAQEPELTVTYGSTTLKAGTDYSVAYTDNVNVGKATASIIGKGDYTGSIQVNFNITAQNLGKIASVSKVTESSAAVTVDGTDGKLVDAKNYDVTVAKNADGKTVTVTVKGKGNYTGTLTQSAEIGADEQVETETLYRLYNPNSGEHFYTTKAGERNYLISVGWRGEGTAWKSPKKGAPVYRLYNKNAGDHHYTTSAGERDALVKLGWNYEGIGWNAAAKTDKGAVPVYRQYNKNAKKAGAHNFTTSKAENDYLVSLGWRSEGVAWYAFK